MHGACAIAETFFVQDEFSAVEAGSNPQVPQSPVLAFQGVKLIPPGPGVCGDCTPVGINDLVGGRGHRLPDLLDGVAQNRVLLVYMPRGVS